MVKKHLIALDLDGTLLKDNKTISQKTKTVIEKAREQGHEVMIATGRPYRSSEMYYRELKLTTPIVNFNGAFVHHPRNKQWGIRHSPLDIKIAKEIVEASQDFNSYNVIAEVLDDVYLHYHDEKLLDIFNLGNPQVTTGDLREFLNASPTSMLIHTDEAHVKQVNKHLSDVHAEVIHHRNWAEPFHIIEIVKAGLSKAVGLQHACDYLQIPKERVIAFGDEDNDLEMLEFAGYGVAMGNGIDQVKTIANEVTLSNEEDGIAVYLNDLLQLKAI
ncbi:Cof-type HAD-IIB family hydrolase [Cytobacillus purgationiresistens]|uniref:Cof subfamily protein (Haloacid dehalogenase superfamily) n=1 Tax=Cytobacillus purgationiresistens TaxID=863449 RepID=A0ABU0ABZ5_9BACI|nr:Cof-type HAD-IIB family hydrolase [Cytobacillus purgationiresistens]MDQ0268772.1 Cof subfamily protein (haloacid dehalogenase superfamily) [Cytobacillus purgationiresistens]